MNRVYLMPKILILSIALVLLTKDTEWFMILLYVLLSTFVVVIYTLVSMYLLGRYYVTRLEKGKSINQEKAYSVIHRHMKLVNSIMRVEIKVEGYENFDKESNYLIVPNHQSNEDALVMMETFKDPIAFVSKHSMSEVILVKDWMNIMGCLFLKKDDLRGQILVMNEVAKSLKEGKSIIIFPEGRRSFGHEMNEFKPGTFKMATKTQVSILPVTMNHVHKFRHHFPWKKTYITVHIHKPLTYDDYKDLNTTEIADKVHAIIASKVVE